MKLISWNVNGLRLCDERDSRTISGIDGLIFCIQESKLQEGQIELELPGYYQYWNYAVKKGYSGTAGHTKQEPLSVRYGINIEEHDQEGRVITLEYPDFFMVTVYTPNSQNELARLPYRMQWEDDFLAYLKGLEKEKPVIFCGDLNVAHCEQDLKNPKTNRKNAGFTDEERTKFSRVLESGFIDTFRYFYPEQEESTLVVLSFKARERMQMADRLFLCVRKPERPAGRCEDPHRDFWIRSLSGRTGYLFIEGEKDGTERNPGRSVR